MSSGWQAVADDGSVDHELRGYGYEVVERSVCRIEWWQRRVVHGGSSCRVWSRHAQQAVVRPTHAKWTLPKLAPTYVARPRHVHGSVGFL